MQELRESRVTLMWGLDAHDDAITTLSVVSEPKGILSGTPYLSHTFRVITARPLSTFSANSGDDSPTP